MKRKQMHRKEGLQQPTPRKQKRDRPTDNSSPLPNRRSASGIEHGFPVRPNCGWQAAEVSQHDRRAQTTVTGDPGGSPLPSQGCGGCAGGAHQPLPSSGVHSQGQRACITVSLDAGAKTTYQARLYGAMLTVTKRICRAIRAPVNYGYISRFRNESFNTGLFNTVAEAQSLANCQLWETPQSISGAPRDVPPKPAQAAAA